MREKFAGAFWGVVLILAGGLFLVQNMGLITVSVNLWKFVFAGLSLAFFATYFISGIRSWGWLFPAASFGAVSIVISLAEGGKVGSAIGAPIMIAIAVPFLVAYTLDRKQNWWALIPMYVMLVIAAITLAADQAPGELIGSVVLFSIALPFLVVFANDRSRKWALIPAFVLAAVGVIPLLTSRGIPGEFIAAFIMFAISLPFFVVYFWSEGNWWAMIPAGVMASIGLALLLSVGAASNTLKIVLINGIIYLGIAATFFMLWLRRATQPTAWAKWPAIGLAVIGLLAVVLGANLNTYWPVLLIATGLLVLFLGIRPKMAQ